MQRRPIRLSSVLFRVVLPHRSHVAVRGALCKHWALLCKVQLQLLGWDRGGAALVLHPSGLPVLRLRAVRADGPQQRCVAVGPSTSAVDDAVVVGGRH